MVFRRRDGIDCERYRGVEVTIWPETDGKWWFHFCLGGRSFLSEAGFGEKQNCINAAHAAVGEALRKQLARVHARRDVNEHRLPTT